MWMVVQKFSALDKLLQFLQRAILSFATRDRKRDGTDDGETSISTTILNDDVVFNQVKKKNKRIF